MDRQDIDALLIGALYGELTPAEEARLTVHLESHPTDRGALDDLKTTRQAILDSRIFQVQLDPPQAVSALLLQEAHRRAPRAVAPSRDEKESWFARFARSFMAHPAMAAAAMLVLVMGGAGIMWMKKGDQFADKPYSQPAAEMQLERNAPAPGASAGSAMNAGVADETDQAKLDELTDGKANEESAAERWSKDSSATTTAEAEGRGRGDLSKNKQATGRLEVNTDRAPKDLDDAEKKADSGDNYASARDKAAETPAPKPATKGTATATATPSAPRAGAGGGGSTKGGDLAFGGETANAVSGAGAPTDDSAGYAPPPPPPQNTKTGPAKAPSSTGGKATTESKPPAQKVAKPTPTEATTTPTVPRAEPAKKEVAKDSALIAWAKGEHAKAVALARNGDCAGAARIAVTVSNRASSYYAQFMGTDRALKGCQARIAAERDADAERSQKARAQKRTNANEPAASDSMK